MNETSGALVGCILYPLLDQHVTLSVYDIDTSYWLIVAYTALGGSKAQPFLGPAGNFRNLRSANLVTICRSHVCLVKVDRDATCKQRGCNQKAKNISTSGQ